MQTEIQIEKGVPVPPRLRRQAGEMAVLLGAMDVGDSFVFEDDKNKNQMKRIKYVAKKIGITTTIRLIAASKYRAWRVE